MFVILTKKCSMLSKSNFTSVIFQTMAGGVITVLLGAVKPCSV
jgi:hypothetical protein